MEQAQHTEVWSKLLLSIPSFCASPSLSLQQLAVANNCPATHDGQNKAPMTDLDEHLFCFLYFYPPLLNRAQLLQGCKLSSLPGCFKIRKSDSVLTMDLQSPIWFSDFKLEFRYPSMPNTLTQHHTIGSK